MFLPEDPLGDPVFAGIFLDKIRVIGIDPDQIEDVCFLDQQGRIICLVTETGIQHEFPLDLCFPQEHSSSNNGLAHKELEMSAEADHNGDFSSPAGHMREFSGASSYKPTLKVAQGCPSPSDDPAAGSNDDFMKLLKKTFTSVWNRTF